MRYSGRHRASKKNYTGRLVTTLTACAAVSTALMAAPANALAADTTPTLQLVVSHVRFVSLVGTPATSAAANLAFDTGVAAQQPYDSVRDDGDHGGGRVPLTRDYPRFDFEDANFLHSAQVSYSGGTFQWSTRLTPAWASIATSPVTETTYWYVNSGKAYGSGHVQAPNYTFHGSFAARPGDTIDMANELTFECVHDGEEATCHGTLYTGYYISG